MISAVIFDMDGLMLDTERLFIESWDWAGEQLGVGPFGHLGYQTLGMTSESERIAIDEAFGGRITLEQVNVLRKEYFRRYFEEHGVPVKPGLFELLKWLKEQGIRTSVATSTPAESALSELRSAGILPYFDEAVCGDMIARSKPAPDIFLAAAAKLGVAPENCMVLEDSLNGIRAAFAAGMTSVMIPDLVQPDDEIRQKYSYCVGSLHDVRPIIEKLNR
ncbi:MAG: HAD family phosphatase [Oscillospiraceae bacterium]|nr:HAD family phosphatase [Oscillospiraceae bacterium]